jgi:hypothetical protein
MNIRINYKEYKLPESMTAKDIQALVGFLSTLQEVESVFSKVDGVYHKFHYVGEFANVQMVAETEMPYASRALAEAARDEYDENVKAKQAAETLMADPED